MLQESVVNLVHISEVIDRIAVFIFVVDAHFVVENRMEAHVFEIRGGLHRIQILAIAVAQRQNRAAGAKHFFPEMWEGRSWPVGIDPHLWLRPPKHRPGAENHNKTHDPHGSITACLGTT